MRKTLSSALVLATLGSLTLGLTVPATAAEMKTHLHEKQVSDAYDSLTSLATDDLIDTSSAALPTVATDGASSELQNGSVGLKTESGGASYTDNGIASTSDSHQIVYQALSDGDARAVIHIDSPGSPTEYPFELTGNFDRIVKKHDGSIEALDKQKNIVASIDRPWAYDADGTSIPTHFEVHERTITQVVEHDESFKYGIVADPTLREHIKKVIAGCLGIQPATFTVWGVLEATFSSWDKAVRFLVRRIGILAAVTCLGGIVYQYL